jgi:GGDEF domain-containing protein
MILFTTTIASLCAAVHYRSVAAKLQKCPDFGCLTRQGIERRKPGRKAVIVFIDIDYMKQANTDYGYNAVNEKIRAVLERITRKGDIVSGRWFSGDEFVFFASGSDGAAICDRIKAEFAADDFGLSLGVTAAWSVADRLKSLTEMIAPLSAEVLAAKAAR